MAAEPDGPVRKTMRERAAETVGVVRDNAGDLADRALDAVPFWDRQDRSEPLDSVLARVSRDLAAASAADPEWAKAAEPELRALAEALARLPPPPEAPPARLSMMRAAPEAPQDFRARPVWPGARADAQAEAFRPGAPQTGFAAVAGMAPTLAPPQPAEPEQAPEAAPAPASAAPAASPARPRAASASPAAQPRPRTRRVARSQPSRPPAPVAAAAACAAACPPPPPLDGSIPFGVILGAYPTQDQARAAWSALGQTEPQLIGGLEPRLFSAPEAGSVMLLAGPLVSRAAAEARCAQARREGASCAAGRFEGEAF